MSKYVIIDEEAIQKRIEELESLSKKDKEGYNLYQIVIVELKQLLSQSTPLIPKIEKAFEAGRKLTLDSFEEEDFQDYENHISNLKLDI